jgi:hypothetical protein
MVCDHRLLVGQPNGRVWGRGEWRTEWYYTPPAHRGGLARRLVAEGALIGRTRAQLVHDLSTPDIENDPPSRFSLGWFTGTRPSGAPMLYPYEEYLVVELDGNDKVVDASIQHVD